MEAHHFTWLESAGVPEQWNHVAMTLIVSAVLILTTAIARGQLARSMASAEGGLVPDAWMLRNFFEIIAESLYKLTESVIGRHDAPIYFPIIGTLFVFIFASNILGLIPGIIPSTENLNTTLALGHVRFRLLQLRGLKAHGIGLLQAFFGTGALARTPDVGH